MQVGICLNSRVSMSVWWGPEWTFFYNDAYTPILGKRHPDAQGQSARVVWSDVWPAISSQLDGVLRGESTVTERGLLPTDRNGFIEDAWFTWSFSPIFNDAAAVVGAFVLAVEETHNVRREQELTETRDKLAATSDRLNLTLTAAEIGSWSFDALTGVVVADANLANAFSISADVAATGAPLQVFTDAIHPDDRAQTVQAINEAMAHGTTFEAEYRLAPRDGVIKWVLGRGRIARDAKGQAVSMSGVLIDITAMRRVQEELRQRDERFRQVADTLPQIVWGADAKGIFDYYNRRWFEFIGLPGSDLEAARWDKFVHPDDLAFTLQTWTASVESGRTYQMEFRARDVAGHYHWFLTRAQPIRNNEGEIVRWFGTCTDIDDRKSIHEESLRIIERERAARLASETAGRMKDDFLATLSHELRTPLNPVLLLASEGSMNMNLPAEVRADFESISKNVALEARLIDDLLDLTRITRGKMALSVAAVDLHSVLTDALANVAPEIAAKKIKLVTHVHATLPVVMADAVRLQQVFWNILRNAAKFTPIGGAITVTSRVTDDRQRVEVLVTDTGMGMSPEEIGKLFNAFVQGDHGGHSGSHRFGGLGLGLAISRMLVELHSGRITGTSDGLGQGSTFSVQLPLEDRFKDTQVSAVVASTSHAPFNTREHPLKVLLVEDHEPTRTSLKHLLLRRHFNVQEAGSVSEAIAVAATTQFDLLLTDIGLPDGDGYQLMQTLQQTQKLKGVALTGYGMQEDIVHSKLVGFSGHLTKPIRVQELEAALAQAIKSP